MKYSEQEVKKAIQKLIEETNILADTLRSEQHDSEAEHEVWEEEVEEDRDDEPDVIDNSEVIDRLEEAMSFLNDAAEVLHD